MVILHNIEKMTRVLKNLQEGVEISQDVLAALPPYRTHHISRLGDYTLDLDREFVQLIFQPELFKKKSLLAYDNQ